MSGLSPTTAATAWAWSVIAKNAFTLGEKFVLLAIAGEAALDGVFYIGFRTLALKSGLDRDFVRHTFRKFRRKRLIEVYAWKRDEGSKSANGYRLAMPLSPDKDLQYILRQFHRSGTFLGITDERGEIRPVQPLILWAERTASGPVGVGVIQPPPGGQGNPTWGLGKPQVGVVQSGGQGVPQPPLVLSQSVLDREPLLKEGSVSSTQGVGKLVADLSDYFRDIQNLLPSLPSVNVRAVDKRFVSQLFHRGVPLAVVEAACWLSVARAQKGPHDFTTIKSFRYFEPVIEEILESKSTAILRQAAFCRLKLLGAAATEQDRRAFEEMSERALRGKPPGNSQRSGKGDSGKGEKHSAHPKRVSNERKKKK